MPIVLENLVKRYVGPDGSVVPVIDINYFRLDDAEQVALIGTSGSGKTTLLHLIAGILAPDRGRIIFDVPWTPTSAQSRGFFARNWPYFVTLGTPMLFYWIMRRNGAARAPDRTAPETREPAARFDEVREEDEKPVLSYRGMAPRDVDGPVNLAHLTEAHRDIFRGQNIGYIFQTHHLLPGFTALENVLLGMSFTGRPSDRRWAMHLLNEVGLSDRMDYRPERLSVGQQQRVAVARALANRPKLVLADEPTGALDAENAQQVLDLIRSLCAEVNASLLLVSHDLNIANQLPRVVTLAELNRAGRAIPALQEK